jgi:hypothetical protein
VTPLQRYGSFDINPEDTELKALYE